MPVVFLDVQELSRKRRPCPPRAHKSLGGVEPLRPVVKPPTPSVDFHDHSPLHQLVIRHKIQWYRDSVGDVFLTLSLVPHLQPPLSGEQHTWGGGKPLALGVFLPPNLIRWTSHSVSLSSRWFPWKERVQGSSEALKSKNACPGDRGWQPSQERCMAVGEATAFSNGLSEIISSLATFSFFPEEEKSNSAPSKLKTHSIFFFYLCASTSFLPLLSIPPITENSLERHDTKAARFMKWSP